MTLFGTPADEPRPCEPKMRSLERRRTKSLSSANLKTTKIRAPESGRTSLDRANLKKAPRKYALWNASEPAWTVRASKKRKCALWNAYDGGPDWVVRTSKKKP